MARMTPQKREDYEHHQIRFRPKYIPMEQEYLARLSPHGREYDYLLTVKIIKCNLRIRPD